MLLNQSNKPPHVLTGQLCLIELVAWGVLYYTFSAFLPYMEAEFRWGSATLAAGFSLAILVSGLGAPLVGAWIDRHGSRGLMVSSAILGSLGVLVWSAATVLPVYFLAWLFIGAAMAGILYAPAFATVVRFNAAASRNAILAITLVAALASTIFIPLSNLLGEWYGWRTALQILAAVLAAATVPLAAALPRPIDAGVQKEESIHEAKRQHQTPNTFWLVTFGLMLADTAGVALNAYLVVFMISQGQALHVAAGIAGLSGVAKIAGRLVFGAGWQISAMTLLPWSLLIEASALALPLLWPSSWSMTAMVIGFGATSGARTVLRPAIVVEMYGAERFGTRNGLLQFYTTLSKSAGPVGLGALVGIAGWVCSWGLLAALVAMSGLLLFGVRPNTKPAVP